MTWIDSLFYGVIQGITEFLPVSSSGHLALLPHYLKINDPGVAFDLAMHVGTALAVLVYFFKDIKEIISSAFFVDDLEKRTRGRSWIINIGISTFVTFVLAYALKDFASDFGRSAFMISLNLVLFGALMWFFDHRGVMEETDHMSKQVDIKRSFLIGFFQGLAVFPGVSRSGSTLTISRFLSMSRVESTRFSFLLSLPVIFAGFVYKLPEVLNSGANFAIVDLVIGLTLSFAVGLATIHYFLKFIASTGLWVFSVYRFVLAIVTLMLFY
ncbi:MAG: undecaprenyl-diphosphate phosphatase [Bacteriovoracaceae bacterium]|nr:undecaprenyl-diphosphate phosphatase [Bacteriovoracaceae bacterium]